MDIVYLIKDLLKTKNLQQWINNRYQPDSNTILIDKRAFPIVITTDSFKLYTNPDIKTYNIPFMKFDFSNLKPTDTVIDIGANIGAYSLFFARKCKYVYAFEPVTFEELNENIALNNFSNIKAFEYGLGDGNVWNITWRGATKLVKTLMFTEILTLSPEASILKCNCEGGEWFINPSDLDQFKKITIELHFFNYCKPNSKLIDYLIDERKGSIVGFQNYPEKQMTIDIINS